MIEAAAIFGGSFVLALSGVLMPGPILTLTIAESTRRGFKAGPLLITGHALTEFALVLAIIHGLGPYLERPLFMGIIASFGGAILMWMGINMVRTASALSLRAEEPTSSFRRRPHPVLMGALASVSNPYWTLWWATVGLGYLVSAMKFGISGAIVFFLGHISADFPWYSIVSLGISRGKALLKDRSYQYVIRVCGVFLLDFGLWFLVSAKCKGNVREKAKILF